MNRFHVRQPNVCGPCTLCCKVLAVVDMTPPKEKDVWCQHAVKGKGCAIYETRPATCQEFHCVWLINNMHPDARPDKIHGVLSSTNDGKNLVLHEDPGWPGHARLRLRMFINSFTKSGEHYVAVVCGTEREMHGTPERLAKMRLVVDDQDSAKHHIIDEVP